MPIETFNISFESTQNKQQDGTKITCTEIRGGGGSYGDKKCDTTFLWVFCGFVIW